MRIFHLEISNIRGIRHFEHDFQGKNAVFLGANGTGKSSVLDAMDFLLTGNISRLEGEGTGNITLKKHGIHQNNVNQPTQGYVKATVRLNGHAQPFFIERYISDSDTLVCLEGESRLFDELKRLASQGQHMLTRRQMLKFITVKPKDRADLIESLMNLEEIEATRANLVSVHNVLKNNLDKANEALEFSKNNVATILGLDRYHSSIMLRTINDCREKLGATLLENVSAKTIRKDISFRVPSAEGHVNPALLIEYVGNILRFIDKPNVKQVFELDQSLRRKLDHLSRDPALRRSFSQQKLLQLGLTLVDDDFCPLCDRPWSQEDLKAHLEGKISQAAIAKQLHADIGRLEHDLREHINDILSNLQQILSAVYFLSDDQLLEFRRWESQLKAFRDALQTRVDTYPIDDTPTDQIMQLFAVRSVKDTVQGVLASLQNYVKKDSSDDNPESVAFARLAQAETALAQLEKFTDRYEHCNNAHIRSASLSKSFLDARKTVIGKLYDGLSDDFASLYRRLHEDEPSFSAKIQPRNAGLSLDVEFYDRGLYPPNALHSEGHQDSMGLCLFLVLSERLSGNDLQVMLLDDVIMSADAGHRKQLARILANDFEERQIILTTHDKVWLKQLESESFASGSNVVEMQRWTIDTVPIYREVRPVWDLIKHDLDSNQINDAGSKLRGWAESFSKQVCHNFKAPVPFRIDGQYTLADVLGPARSSVRKYLKKALMKAQRNNNSERSVELISLDNRMQQVDEAIEKESWVVNWASHDNQRDSLTANEVEDVVAAFRKFDELLHCPNCCGFLELTNRREAIVCRCGHVSWRV